jgi:2-iminobutanoate/2-iminopropanoate deaminase
MDLQQKARAGAVVLSVLTTMTSGAHAAESANVPAIRAINASDAPAPAGGYSQAVEVKGARRILFISGQIPVDRAGDVPDDFESQCRLVWSALAAQLRAAGMNFGNLVKVTTYLSERRFAAENSRIRRELLDGHAPALTVIITGIYDERWYLEIEAIAAD